jgi:hypothetical protein
MLLPFLLLHELVQHQLLLVVAVEVLLPLVLMVFSL